jgi:hypothetical protein
MILETIDTEDFLRQKLDEESLRDIPLFQQMRFPIVFDQSTQTFLCTTYSGVTVAVDSSNSTFSLLQRLMAGLQVTQLGTALIFPALVSLERECGIIVLRYGPRKFKVPCEMTNALLPILSVALGQRGINLQGLNSFTF